MNIRPELKRSGGFRRSRWQEQAGPEAGAHVLNFGNGTVRRGGLQLLPRGQAEKIEPAVEKLRPKIKADMAICTVMTLPFLS
jgi:hypothetical protein